MAVRIVSSPSASDREASEAKQQKGQTLFAFFPCCNWARDDCVHMHEMTNECLSSQKAEHFTSGHTHTVFFFFVTYPLNPEIRLDLKVLRSMAGRAGEDTARVRI